MQLLPELPGITPLAALALQGLRARSCGIAFAAGERSVGLRGAFCLNAVALSTEFCTGRGGESFGASARMFLCCWASPRRSSLTSPTQRKLAGLLRFCPSGSAWCRETVEFSCEGPLDKGHMRRYTKVARSRPGDGGSTTFCGVHTWQMKVNLLAMLLLGRTSTHE
jgi:hypothetical protein